MIQIKNNKLYCTTHKRFCDEACKKCDNYRDCPTCRYMNIPVTCEPCNYCHRTEEHINWEGVKQ